MPALSTALPQSRKAKPTSQVLVGTGFLALDLLFRNQSLQASKRYAGGSFGNVMAILAYLGWKSYPVARIGTDDHARTVLDDLEEFRVDTKFVRRAGAGATPVIVVRVIETADGVFKSKFEWRDPRSGERLPSYRPLPQFLARELSPALPKARVFYFDRAEPSSLLLAKEMRKRGALIFFEPSSCKDVPMFSACMAVSDIVKYSAQRITDTPHNPDSDSPRLEIQTLGDQGLRYRFRTGANQLGPWCQIPAFATPNFRDATGCGDWCSAGLLHQIGKKGRAGFLRLDQSKIEDGLKFGQALSSVNARYEGARGPMYNLKISELLKIVGEMLAA